MSINQQAVGFPDQIFFSWFEKQILYFFFEEKKIFYVPKIRDLYCLGWERIWMQGRTNDHLHLWGEPRIFLFEGEGSKNKTMILDVIYKRQVPFNRPRKRRGHCVAPPPPIQNPVRLEEGFQKGGERKPMTPNPPPDVYIG